MAVTTQLASLSVVELPGAHLTVVFTGWNGMVLVSHRAGDIALQDIAGIPGVNQASSNLEIIRAWAAAALDETDQQCGLGQFLSPRRWAKHLRLTNDDLRMLAEEQ